MGGDRVGGRWGGAYTLLLTLVKSRRLTTSANSNRLRSLRSKRLSYDCTRTSSPVPSQKRLGSCTSLSLSLFTHDNQLSGQVPSAAIAKLIRLKELQLGASLQGGYSTTVPEKWQRYMRERGGNRELWIGFEPLNGPRCV